MILHASLENIISLCCGCCYAFGDYRIITSFVLNINVLKSWYLYQPIVCGISGDIIMYVIFTRYICISDIHDMYVSLFADA